MSEEITTSPPHSAQAQGPQIEFRDLHTRWQAGGQRVSPTAADRGEALTGLSLTVPPGQITVLLGDHQSGKSLLALHLLGELAPDSGHVQVGGQSLWELPEQQRRAIHDRFGVLRGGTTIRESELDPHRSVRDNFVDQLRSSDAAALAEQAASDCLEYFDLSEYAEAKPDQLDAAARRRLALALALAADPQVVVIDDPGEALDVTHLEGMLESIKGWQARTEATVLITVHSLRVARELGHQVAVLRGGEVIAHGAPADVLDGVVDDQSYEQRFGTSIGGVAEADPERSGNRTRLLNLAENRRHIAFVVAFFVLAVVIIAALLFSGVLDQGTGDNGGSKAGTHGLQ